MPGLGTGSSPSSCPNRSSSDWPAAHRPGRPAMSRTATRQAWPVRQPTAGPQPTPPGPSIKPPEPLLQPPPPGSLAAKWLVTRVPVAGPAEKCQNPPQPGHVQAGYRSESFGIMRL